MVGLLTALPNTQLTRRLAREGRLLPFRAGSGGDQCTSGLNFVTARRRRRAGSAIGATRKPIGDVTLVVFNPRNRREFPSPHREQISRVTPCSGHPTNRLSCLAIHRSLSRPPISARGGSDQGVSDSTYRRRCYSPGFPTTSPAKTEMTKFPARLITTNQIEASDVLRFELLDAADLVHFASARLRNPWLTLCCTL